jgi:hypothetical protein
MQRSVDEFGSAEYLAIWNWTAAVLAVHSAIFLTLVGLAMGYPGASEWLSAAVQGEFWHDRAPPAAPMQIAVDRREAEIEA